MRRLRKSKSRDIFLHFRVEWLLLLAAGWYSEVVLGPESMFGLTGMEEREASAVVKRMTNSRRVP